MSCFKDAADIYREIFSSGALFSVPFTFVSLFRFDQARNVYVCLLQEKKTSHHPSLNHHTDGKEFMTMS